MKTIFFRSADDKGQVMSEWLVITCVFFAILSLLLKIAPSKVELNSQLDKIDFILQENLPGLVSLP